MNTLQFRPINKKLRRWKKSFLQWIFFPQFKRRKVGVHWRSYIGPNTTIGEHTNITGPIFIDSREDIRCSIGKYCLISHNVRIRLANHSTSMLNMQSAFQLEYGLKRSHADKGDVVIGNNVWIGDNSIILPGVHIGNGAVIGAGSVVTKSVPDYAIYCGNPAGWIKYRFDDSKRQILKNIDWWNWDREKIKRHRDLFNADINALDDKTLIKMINIFEN